MIRVKYKEVNNTVHVRPVQRTKNNTKDIIDRNKDVYLVRLSSDMTGRVSYFYADTITDYGPKRSNYQYTDLTFKQVTTLATEDLYNSKVYLNPAGYWYYIIYEVNFPNGSTLPWEGGNYDLISAGYAPINDRGDYGELPVGGPNVGNRGILGIAVEEGKLYVNQDPSQITYTEHKQDNTNYIYTE